MKKEYGQTNMHAQDPKNWQRPSSGGGGSNLADGAGDSAASPALVYPNRLFYISFATDEGFRGATVVSGTDAKDAFLEATRRGLNPGGEAAILELPPGLENKPDVKMMMFHLATKEEMLAHGAKRKADCPPDIQDAFDSEAHRVCSMHNTGGRQ